MKVIFSNFHLNGLSQKFHSRTQKLEPHMINNIEFEAW